MSKNIEKPGLTLAYHPTDHALASRLQADLHSLPPGKDALIVVLSPLGVEDPAVQQALIHAVDRNRLIVPILAKPTALPKIIEHLYAVDFTQDYDFGLLEDRLNANVSNFHMKVSTPNVRASNQRAGLVMAVIAFIMFLGGLYLVGVVGIQAPVNEYNSVETEIVLTRNYFIDAALPRSTDEALNFEATVRAAAPTVRPMLVATATAMAEQ